MCDGRGVAHVHLRLSAIFSNEPRCIQVTLTLTLTLTLILTLTLTLTPTPTLTLTSRAASR